jgi:hypothetical protein
MKKIFATLLVVCAFAALLDAQVPVRTLPACTREGQTVTLSLNTGTAGPLPPPATADPFWRLVSGAPVFTTSPVGPNLWLANSPLFRWVQPANNGGNPASYPVATYVYQAKFSTPVDPYLYSSIQINGAFALDDVGDMELNGVPIGKCAGGTTPAAWCFNKWINIGPTGWTNFNRSTGFVNTLTVRVKNTDPGSPSGLLVRANVVAVCSKCTSPLPPVNPPCGGNPSNC